MSEYCDICGQSFPIRYMRYYPKDYTPESNMLESGMKCISCLETESI